MSSLTRTVSLAAALAVAGSACGGDSVTFPDVNSSVLSQFCIRGQAAVPGDASQSGSVSSADCNDGGNDGYYEGWHVRAAEVRSVTFEIMSDFDSWLEVYRVLDVNDPANTSTLIAQDDDSGEGLDARLTVSLQPDTDYVVFVSGYDDSEVGNYSLSFQ